MDPIQLTGLSSGFDFRPVLDALISVEQIPQRRLQSERSTLQTKSSVYDTLKSRLEDLQTSLEGLDDEDMYFGRKSSVNGGTDSNITASVNDKTTAGSYKFNITKLATSTTASGSADVGSSLGNTSTNIADLNFSTVVSSGTITVNGAQIELDRNASLQTLFDDILTATTAAGDAVTASYDSGTDQITFSAASGNVYLGSATDTSNFFTSAKLRSTEGGDAVSTSALGGLNFSASLDGGSTGLNNAITSDGSFFVNGEEINIDVSEDSLSSIISRINESDAGVTISYDSANDQFTLTNNATGSIAMALDDNGSGFFNAIGVDTANINYDLGEDAEFTLNDGSTLTSNSNVLNSDVHGIEGLNVTAKDIGIDTVQVDADSGNARKAIEEFITKFNEVQAFLDSQTDITVNEDTVTTGILASNSDISSLVSEMRKTAFQSVPGLDGVVKRLQDMGIDFKTNSNELEIEDSSALDDALEENSGSIATLFTDSTDGLITKLDTLVENFIGDNGTLETFQDTITRQVNNIDRQIDVQERLVAQRRQILEDSFLRMENMQAQLNNYSSILNSTF